MDVLLSQSSGNDMWTAVKNFQLQLLRQERVSTLRDQCLNDAVAVVGPQTPSDAESREVVLRQIETVIENILKSLSKNEAPCLVYANRTTWDNLRYDEGRGLEMLPDCSQTCVRFDSVSSVNKFTLTLKVLQHMYNLVQTNTYSTKRDLYYHDPKAFGSQTVVNDIVDNISCMLRVPRWRLHMLATSKGLVAGDLKYIDAEGSRVDCAATNTGCPIPSHVMGITSIQSGAKAVLLVEKDASFQRLLDDNICQKLAPIIVVTGKGFPDLATRLFVRRLWDSLHLPILTLVDADPHGIEIMAIYRFGSMSLAFEARNLAVPAVRWLGVWPSDVTRMQVPREALLPLTRADVDKAQEILRRPYIGTQPQWKREVEQLLQMNVKAEIQCLQSISPNFLSEVYIPNKLRYEGWI